MATKLPYVIMAVAIVAVAAVALAPMGANYSASAEKQVLLGDSDYEAELMDLVSYVNAEEITAGRALQAAAAGPLVPFGIEDIVVIADGVCRGIISDRTFIADRLVDFSQCGPLVPVLIITDIMPSDNGAILVGDGFSVEVGDYGAAGADALLGAEWFPKKDRGIVLGAEWFPKKDRAYALILPEDGQID